MHLWAGTAAWNRLCKGNTQHAAPILLTWGVKEAWRQFHPVGGGSQGPLEEQHAGGQGTGNDLSMRAHTTGLARMRLRKPTNKQMVDGTVLLNRKEKHAGGQGTRDNLCGCAHVTRFA